MAAPSSLRQLRDETFDGRSQYIRVEHCSRWTGGYVEKNVEEAKVASMYICILSSGAMRGHINNWMNCRGDRVGDVCNKEEITFYQIDLHDSFFHHWFRLVLW